jgi:hypothetical protein
MSSLRFAVGNTADYEPMDQSQGYNLFMDPNYMDSFFPFPPIENDGTSNHSGGSVPHQPLPSPQMGYYGQGSSTLLPQQPGQNSNWW